MSVNGEFYSDRDRFMLGISNADEGSGKLSWRLINRVGNYVEKDYKGDAYFNFNNDTKRTELTFQTERDNWVFYADYTSSGVRQHDNWKVVRTSKSSSDPKSPENYSYGRGSAPKYSFW
ncbi:hypothetical protein [Pseudomonas sp. HLT2-19-2]